MDGSTRRSSGRGRGRGRWVVFGVSVSLVLVAGLFGAVLGYAIPARTGMEEATGLSITFAVTPWSVALYGIVAVGTFVGT